MRSPKLRLSLGLSLLWIAVVAFSIQGARIVSRAIFAGQGLGHARAEHAAHEAAIRLSREGSVQELNAALGKAKYHGNMKDYYSKRLRSIP